MADYSFPCDVVQGFNFNPDVQTKVGHIETIDIAERGELVSDLEVDNPLDRSKIKVFGIVSDIYWSGGITDPIQFSCQVSVTNKKSLQKMVRLDMSNTNVKFKFTIYSYDPDNKKYFTAYWSEAELLGLIEKMGGDLNINIDEDAGYEVQSPENYAFSLGVAPVDDQAQEVHFAVSETDKMVKQWGIARAA